MTPSQKQTPTSPSISVFRIPRFQFSDESATYDRRTRDQVAVLNYLTENSFPTPRLHTYDCTTKNEVSSPFVAQEFASGLPLSVLYEDMDFTNKLKIAGHLAGFMVRMEMERFPHCGVISAVDESATDPPRAIVRGFEVGFGKGAVQQPASTNLDDLLWRQLHGWSKYKRLTNKKGEFIPKELDDMWTRLIEILGEMRALEFLSATRTACGVANVLHHWDLFPRNIIVSRTRITGETSLHPSWRLDKVIDWDDVKVVPVPLTRQPPVWLWDFSDDTSGHPSISSDYDGDVDLFATDRYAPKSERLSPENAKIKEHFEQCFIRGLRELDSSMTTDAYFDDAYGSGRWLRRLARFALHGGSYSQDFQRFQHFDRQWSRFYID